MPPGRTTDSLTHKRQFAFLTRLKIWARVQYKAALPKLASSTPWTLLPDTPTPHLVSMSYRRTPRTPTWRHLGEQSRQPHPQLPLRVQHVRHGVVIGTSTTTTTGRGQRAAAKYGSRRVQRVLRYHTG